MYQLVLGNKNYSSWSMRGWLLMKLARLEFDETVIALADVGWHDVVRDFGGQAGKVPVLLDDDFAIWDSLAIAEFVHERTHNIWPLDPYDRARARSLAAEMHSGFPAIRSVMPCNIRARDRIADHHDRLAAEIARVDEIWSSARGPYLFGEFCGADIFFAPVATRFRTYGVTLSGPAVEYQEQLLSQPLVEVWAKQAETGPLEPRYELPPRSVE